MTPEHHCFKEGQLSALEVATRNISEQLKEQNDTMKQLVSVLQLVAAQGQQIIGLQASVDRNTDAIISHDTRLNFLEVAQAKEKVRVGFLLGGMSGATSLITAVAMKYLK